MSKESLGTTNIPDEGTAAYDQSVEQNLLHAQYVREHPEKIAEADTTMSTLIKNASAFRKDGKVECVDIVGKNNRRFTVRIQGREGMKPTDNPICEGYAHIEVEETYPRGSARLHDLLIEKYHDSNTPCAFYKNDTTEPHWATSSLGRDYFTPEDIAKQDLPQLMVIAQLVSELHTELRPHQISPDEIAPQA
jgi:hypothetical protein